MKPDAFCSRAFARSIGGDVLVNGGAGGVFGNAAQVTDANSAFFDTANGFSGCIAGLHEVLRRQGLMENIYCLNPEETLSPGQLEQIDRVYRAYPEQSDDGFIAANLENWKMK